MKAPDFAYARPTALADVFALLAEHGDQARILAGGQSLMASLNMRLSSPSLLIDLARLPGLTGIEQVGGMIRIGAMTRHADVLNAPLVQSHVPLIAQAMAHVAHPAVRNRGTHGGSICFADPAAEMPACALALNATLDVQGADGPREIKARDFFHDLYSTDLQPGEILTAVRYPMATATSRFAFDEIARRDGDYALAGLAAAADVQGGQMKSLELVFFGIGAKAERAPKTAELLLNTPINTMALDRAASILRTEIEPFASGSGSAAFKTQLMTTLLHRVTPRLVQI